MSGFPVRNSFPTSPLLLVFAQYTASFFSFRKFVIDQDFIKHFYSSDT